MAVQARNIEKEQEMLSSLNSIVHVCRLYDVPADGQSKWCRATTDKLFALFPLEKEPVLLKMIKAGDGVNPPLVTLLMKDDQGRLMSINDTINQQINVFRDHSTTGDSNNNLDDDFKEISPPYIPEKGSYFDINVVYAATPTNFIVQSLKDGDNFEYMMESMQEYYNKCEKIRLSGVQISDFYAHLHTDEVWYRVRINHIVGDQVMGSFIDYGDQFCCNDTMLQPLVAKFRKLPHQAYQARLHGIAPVHRDWDPEVCYNFQELVSNKAFVSKVEDIIFGVDGHVLSLSVIDTSHPKIDVYIEKDLVKKGDAVFIDDILCGFY